MKVMPNSPSPLGLQPYFQGKGSDVLLAHPELEKYLPDSVTATDIASQYVTYFPEGVKVSDPVVCALPPIVQGNPIIHYIVLAKDAQAICLVNENNVQGETIPAFQAKTFAYLQPDATLTYICYQNASGSELTTQFNAVLSHRCQLLSHYISLNGKTIRNCFSIDLQEDESSCFLRGLSVLNRDEKVEEQVEIRHISSHCHSEQSFKHLLNDHASGKFVGRIIVLPHAQKTEAYQKSHNMVLSKNAVMHIEPQLEIYADDVQCSHGATVGQIDKEALFYMQQRGIGEQDAYRLLLKAFVSDLWTQIPVTSLQDLYSEEIEKKIETMIS